MRRYLAILALLVPWNLSATGARIEMPLPLLNGLYAPSCCSCGVSGSATFRFDRLPINIYGASIRLVGYVQPGDYYCDWYVVERAWSMQFTATMADSTSGGIWRAGMTIVLPDQYPPLNEPFPFDVEISFGTQSGATWEFLKAGRGSVSFVAAPYGIPTCGLSCIPGPRPSAEIQLAVLIIEADCLIGVDRTTWGSIKALFRE